ncbi:MAG TPA: dihydrodipicolinate reductase [Anaeromyxobacteraceae bacterium]|nr:dihydrodipicolinate reductase [Anaeromyxobacteraceae bacterium]
MAESGIPVVVMGLGEVGRAIARRAAAHPDLRLVGAVDPAKGIAGRKLDDLLGAPAGGLTVASDPAKALQAARGGVVLLATTSSFEAALPVIERAVRAGCSVVSTCEELAWPWLHHEEAAGALDALCEEHDVAVVGTGVNPGFALDRLPAFLAQVTGEVRHVRGLRVVDLAQRRDALRKKAGVGLTEAAFEAAEERGEVGHVGLSESAALAAAGCGLEVDEVEEELVPLVAEEAGHGLAPGQVAGLSQVARAFQEGREVVRLELVFALGAEDPRDEVELDADPPLQVVVPGGVPGEPATVAAVVHAALAVTERRGLITVLDLPAGR